MFTTFGVMCSREQTSLICKRFDLDEDGKLGFWEFTNIFYSPAAN